MQISITSPFIKVRPWVWAGRWPAIGVLMFGLVVLYVVGFSSLPRAHGATHDARHASGFPCH
jgi:cobalt transporter subunit CbtB